MLLNYLVLFSVLFYTNNCQEEGEFTSKILRKNISNFLEYEDSRYYFNTEFQANFYSAFQFCKIRNMELLSIESVEENNRIGLYLIENGIGSRRFWTSAVNMVDSGKWTWLATGKEVKYFNWDIAEPTGTIFLVNNYETCIQVRHEGNRGFTWNDLNCGRKNYIICEAPIVCKCLTPRGAF